MQPTCVVALVKTQIGSEISATSFYARMLVSCLNHLLRIAIRKLKLCVLPRATTGFACKRGTIVNVTEWPIVEIAICKLTSNDGHLQGQDTLYSRLFLALRTEFNQLIFFFNPFMNSSLWIWNLITFYLQTQLIQITSSTNGSMQQMHLYVRMLP